MNCSSCSSGVICVTCIKYFSFFTIHAVTFYTSWNFWMLFKAVPCRACCSNPDDRSQGHEGLWETPEMCAIGAQPKVIEKPSWLWLPPALLAGAVGSRGLLGPSMQCSPIYNHQWGKCSHQKDQIPKDLQTCLGWFKVHCTPSQPLQVLGLGQDIHGVAQAE